MFQTVPATTNTYTLAAWKAATNLDTGCGLSRPITFTTNDIETLRAYVEASTEGAFEVKGELAHASIPLGKVLAGMNAA